MTGHQGTTRLVAVKTVKEGASEREKEDLVRELKIMQQLGSHPNVVTLLGCCTEQGRLTVKLTSIIHTTLRIIFLFQIGSIKILTKEFNKNILL